MSFKTSGKTEDSAADKEKALLDQVCQVAATTVRLLNEEIPRPVLGGLAPARNPTGAWRGPQAGDRTVSRGGKGQI